MRLSVCVSWDHATFDAVPFQGDFEAHTKACADIGFDGVELAIRDPLEVDMNMCCVPYTHQTATFCHRYWASMERGWVIIHSS